MPRPKKEKPPNPNDKVFELYGGQVVVTFRESSHRYRVSDNGSKPVQTSSVTTILGVLNKPALVPWACNCVANYMQAGFQELIAGNSFSIDSVFKLIKESRNASEKIKLEAAEIGTNAHDWARDFWLAHIQKTDKPTVPTEQPLKNCITSLLNWVSQHKVVPLYIEHGQYSRKYKITGRPDFIGYVDDVYSVIDYKSTKCLWPEVPLQLAPYANFHEEEHGKLPVHRWGLRMDKAEGVFEDRLYPESQMAEDFDTFLACEKIHSRLKHLRRKPKPVDFLAELEGETE